MNRYQNEEIAWLHLQDMQREAENRRLTARRPSAVVAAIRRMFGRTPAAVTSPRPQSAEVRQNPV